MFLHWVFIGRTLEQFRRRINGSFRARDYRSIFSNTSFAKRRSLLIDFDRSTKLIECIAVSLLSKSMTAHLYLCQTQIICRIFLDHTWMFENLREISQISRKSPSSVFQPILSLNINAGNFPRKLLISMLQRILIFTLIYQSFIFGQHDRELFHRVREFLVFHGRSINGVDRIKAYSLCSPSR